MESAKVTFSKEFEEKTKYKKLSRKQKNRLRMQKFESLSSSKLSQCHTVMDIIRVLGMEEPKSQSQAGRKFVNKLLQEKKILAYETGEIRGAYRLFDYCFPSTDPRSKENLSNTPIVEKAKTSFSPYEILSKLPAEKLASVHTRRELAKLLGYDFSIRDERRKGSSNITNLIRDKKLIEERTGERKGNTLFANYSRPGDKKITPATVAEKVTENITRVAEKVATRITISCNSVNITLEDPTPEIVNTVLEKIPLS